MLHADHRPDVVEVFESNLLGRFIKLRRHRDVTLDAREILEEMQRLLATDREWDEDARIHHRRFQWQHRQMRRHRSFEIRCRDFAHKSDATAQKGQADSLTAELLGG
jgi:hypothetical protein